MALTTKFKLGDKVMGVNFTGDYAVLNGKKGKVVVDTSTTGGFVGVEWEISFKDGHNCEGHGKKDKCRFFTIYENRETAKIHGAINNATNYFLIPVINKQMEFEF